jgi:hypothetical protein
MGLGRQPDKTTHLGPHLVTGKKWQQRRREDEKKHDRPVGWASFIAQ